MEQEEKVNRFVIPLPATGKVKRGVFDFRNNLCFCSTATAVLVFPLGFHTMRQHLSEAAWLLPVQETVPRGHPLGKRPLGWWRSFCSTPTPRTWKVWAELPVSSGVLNPKVGVKIPACGCEQY